MIMTILIHQENSFKRSENTKSLAKSFLILKIKYHFNDLTLGVDGRRSGVGLRESTVQFSVGSWDRMERGRRARASIASLIAAW